jgi:hypothetical protein
VEPLDENKDAIKIFFLIKHQLIMGMNGPVDLNHQAIHEAIRLYGIRKSLECFEKVIVIGRWWLGEIARESERYYARQ